MSNYTNNFIKCKWSQSSQLKGKDCQVEQKKKATSKKLILNINR